MIKFKLVVVIHNVRSAHNVGSILRSADGFGISHVFFTGYTPFPKQINDERLPHLSAKIEQQIHKTALGAEKTVSNSQDNNIGPILEKLAAENFLIAALEQTPSAIDINRFHPKQNIALVVGNEVEGLDQDTLNLCPIHLQIPMRGQKESFNVSVAAAIAMYHLQLNFSEL